MEDKSKKKIAYFVGAVLSALASSYALLSSIFYSWMNANGTWSEEKASIATYSAVALSIIFLFITIWFFLKMRQLRKQNKAT